MNDIYNVRDNIIFIAKEISLLDNAYSYTMSESIEEKLDEKFSKLIEECIKYIALDYEPNGDCAPDNYVEYMCQLYWEARRRQ